MVERLREAVQPVSVADFERFLPQHQQRAPASKRSGPRGLAETLQQLADTIRDRKMAREKLAALTAEVRMSAMIVGGLPFFVSGVLLFIRPTYLLPLIETTYGRILLGVAIGSLTIGFTAMRAVSQVED